MVKQKNARRHLGVTLESIDSKLDLVLEGVVGVDERTGRHYKEFQDFRKEVNYKFDVVFGELSIIRNDLKQKIDREEFALLEKRVIMLERAVHK